MSSELNVEAEELPVKTGLDRADRERLAELLNESLASTYVLYAKTHAIHWNVAGPLFYSVHKLTDDQYNELAEAIDNIAERIRAIGFPALHGLRHYLDISVVPDMTQLAGAEEMVRTLAEDHQALAAKLREAVEEADDVDDVFTADLLTQRIGVHEEASWMLNAIIAQESAQ